MLKSDGTDMDGPLGLSTGTALGHVPNRYQLVLLHTLVTIVLCYQLLFSRDALLSFELRQLVALGLIGSIVGLLLLFLLRPEEAQPLHYAIFAQVTIALAGLAVGYQVWRMNVLREYYGERL